MDQHYEIDEAAAFGRPRTPRGGVFTFFDMTLGTSLKVMEFKWGVAVSCEYGYVEAPTIFDALCLLDEQKWKILKEEKIDREFQEIEAQIAAVKARRKARAKERAERRERERR